MQMKSGGLSADVSTASPAVPSLGTLEPFTKFVAEDYVGIEQHSEGRAVQRSVPYSKEFRALSF